MTAFVGVFVAAPLALTHRTTWPLETDVGRYALSLAGMPAFKGAYNDNAIWSMVAYLRALQGKTVIAAPTPARTTPTPTR